MMVLQEIMLLDQVYHFGAKLLISQLVLGWGCKTLHINSCIVSIVFIEVLHESRYIGHDFDP